MTKNEELKEIVQTYFDNKKNYQGISQFIKSKYKNLYDYIFEFTKQLDDKYTFNHRLYWTINNINQFPQCNNCKKENKRIVSLDGYNGNLKYCCLHCVKVSSEVIQKTKNTCILKYGVDNPAKSYDIQKKMDESNFKKFGFKRASQLQEYKDNNKKIFLEKYGVENCFYNQDVINKRNKTNLEKYGFISPLQNKEVKQKSNQTIREKYGVDYITQNKSIMDQIKKTNLEKYGSECIFQSNWFLNLHRKFYQEKCYNRLLNNKYVELLTSKDDFLNLNNTSNYKWKCKKCGKIFESKKDPNEKADSGICVRCPKCFPLQYFDSYGEQEIVNFIKAYYPNIIIQHKNREILNGQELDLFIENKKIAIEYDGLYWHSYSKLKYNKNYHLNKTELCESKNIQLIHIFEDEWIYKKDIVKSRLLSIFGKYINIIYARNCIIKNIDLEEYKNFLNMNHIQGYVNSDINYGLYYNNELVSLMSFGKLRKSLGQKTQENEYELLRFCNKLNHHIPGAASKLFTHFVKNYNPIKIISYADRRWSIGNLYNKLGFKHIRNSNPNYWYIFNNIRKHRFGFRKDILKHKLQIFDSKLTEYQNMFMNGYDCIYDCGNMVFIWNKE